MKFVSLKDFLLNKMSMSHMYQPVLVRALVDSGGSATVRQLAYEFLRQRSAKNLIVLDGHPVTPGHTLICPKRSFADLVRGIQG